MLDDMQTVMPGKGTLEVGEPYDGKKEPGSQPPLSSGDRARKTRVTEAQGWGQ